MKTVTVISEHINKIDNFYCKALTKKYLWGLIKLTKVYYLSNPYSYADIILTVDEPIQIGSTWQDINRIIWRAIDKNKLRNYDMNLKMIYTTPKSLKLMGQQFFGV